MFSLKARITEKGTLMNEQFDVVVAGAGPVGLMLACELGLAGVRTLVVERRREIDMTIKAGALSHATLQSLDRRGFAPALEAATAVMRAKMEEFRRQQSAAAPGGKPAFRFIGHFGGIQLDGGKLDPDDADLAAQARLADLGMVGQQQLEAILEARALELGVEIRRGVTLESFEDTGDGILVTTDRAVVEAGWLAGCDGGRSTVRKLAGFDFPGTAPEITAYQSMVEMTGTEGLRPGWHATPTGVYTFGPMPGRILVAEFDGAPADRTTPVTIEELQGAIRRVTGVDVTVHAITTATRFTDNARQATSYRRGRVLLAGDAAHVHSPFGGQGLNLGIGDAMNLGFKLAATVTGRASEDLLDTYTRERHPIGAWVLDWTRAQIAIMRPDAHARAARAVFEGMADTVDGTTFLAKQLSGGWQSYDLGGGHPLVGRSAPDLALADGTRLSDHLHDGRAVLLDLADDAELRALADGLEHGLAVVSTTADAAIQGLLVRPDGFVAWASPETGSRDGLADALATWVGSGRAVAAAA